MWWRIVHGLVSLDVAYCVIHKISRIGLNVKFIHWLSSYLTNRKQRVVIGGKFSKIMTLLAGVPQGSILGPLLFLLFINDLEVSLESDVNLFADDTILINVYNNVMLAETTLNSDLSKIQNWAAKWQVEFNPVKTVFMNFSLKKINPNWI